jgi:hypothetical protein
VTLSDLLFAAYLKVDTYFDLASAGATKCSFGPHYDVLSETNVGMHVCVYDCMCLCVSMCVYSVYVSLRVST